MGTTLDKLKYLEDSINQIKDAIRNKGQTINNTDSLRSCIDKINDIQTGTDVSMVTATPNDVRSGRVYVDNTGEVKTGKMLDTTPLFKEVSDLSSVGKYTLTMTCENVNLIAILDNTWYVVSNNTLKIINQSYDVELPIEVQAPTYIDVNCKNYYGDNTNLICISETGKIHFFIYNTETQELTFKATIENENVIYPAINPKLPYLVTSNPIQGYDRNIWQFYWKINDDFTLTELRRWQDHTGGNSEGYGWLVANTWLSDRVFGSTFESCNDSSRGGHNANRLRPTYIYGVSTDMQTMTRAGDYGLIVSDGNTLALDSVYAYRLYTCSLDSAGNIIKGDSICDLRTKMALGTSTNICESICGFLGDDLIYLYYVYYVNSNYHVEIIVWNIDSNYNLIEIYRNTEFSGSLTYACNNKQNPLFGNSLSALFTFKYGAQKLLDKMTYGDTLLVNTADATATSADIVEGTSAYVNGQKIMGSAVIPLSQIEHDTAMLTAQNILGGLAISNKKISNTNVYTYPEYAILPDLSNVSLVGPMGQGHFEYYDENGNLISKSEGTLGMTTSELLTIFPYYAVIFKENDVALYFAEHEWYINASDTTMTFQRYDDIHATIGSCRFIPGDIIDTKVAPMDYIMNLEIESIEKSTSGGASGYEFISENTSFAIYGNVKIVDNTTNKIYS